MVKQVTTLRNRSREAASKTGIDQQQSTGLQHEQ
jgi:hypothetical protein